MLPSSAPSIASAVLNNSNTLSTRPYFDPPSPRQRHMSGLLPLASNSKFLKVQLIICCLAPNRRSAYAKTEVQSEQKAT